MLSAEVLIYLSYWSTMAVCALIISGFVQDILERAGIRIEQDLSIPIGVFSIVAVFSFALVLIYGDYGSIFYIGAFPGFIVSLLLVLKLYRVL